MIAVPKRWFYSDEVKTVPQPGGGFWIECEITQPPSSAGRNIDVFIDPETVTSLLLAARDEARRARSVTLSGGPDDR